MVEFYEAAEDLRKQRAAEEEAARQREKARQKREEEERLRRAQQKRYDEEVVRTNALINAAQDYDMACTIRAYVQAVGIAPEINEEWTNWAKDKANWYDPTIAQEDDFFGVREHQKSASEKELKASRSYWRW